MIEVEVKLPIPDPEGVKNRILEAGFKEQRFIEERDTYFDNARGDIRANGEALRVRETKDCRTGKKQAQINYKGKKLDTQTMTRRELETGVEDGGGLPGDSAGHRVLSRGTGSNQDPDNAAERFYHSLSG